MKYTIMGFNQQKLIEYKLDMVEITLLRWFVDFWNTGKMRTLQYNNKDYVWIDYGYLLTDLPILQFEKEQLRRRLMKMVKKGILEHYTLRQGGVFSYYHINSEMLRGLISDTPAPSKKDYHRQVRPLPPEGDTLLPTGSNPLPPTGSNKDSSTKDNQSTINVREGSPPSLPTLKPLNPSPKKKLRRKRSKSVKVMELIKGDKDWIRGYTILKGFFPTNLIDPRLLRYSDMMTLQELLMDSNFDFKGYCKWYYEVKYPFKSFTWGLFMYPAVISEFNAVNKESSTYLKTTSKLKDNDAFQKDVEDTKKWIADTLKHAKAKRR